MKLWSTYIMAINPVDGELTEFCGQNIEAPSKKLAHEYCQNNGLGYLNIDDEILQIIPCKKGSNFEADFSNASRDYWKEQCN